MMSKFSPKCPLKAKPVATHHHRRISGWQSQQPKPCRTHRHPCYIQRAPYFHKWFVEQALLLAIASGKGLRWAYFRCYRCYCDGCTYWTHGSWSGWPLRASKSTAAAIMLIGRADPEFLTRTCWWYVKKTQRGQSFLHNSGDR